LLDIARKEFADGNIMTVDEKDLEKEWPGLRSELSIGARAWRHKGLELIGVPANAPVALELPESGAGVSPVVPDSPSRFHIPLRTPHSEVRTLDVQGDDINLFAGLPLFELA